MFAYLKGKLEVKTKGYIVIDVGGVGYKVFMSETAIEKLEEVLKIKIEYDYQNKKVNLIIE